MCGCIERYSLFWPLEKASEVMGKHSLKTWKDLTWKSHSNFASLSFQFPGFLVPKSNILFWLWECWTKQTVGFIMWHLPSILQIHKRIFPSHRLNRAAAVDSRGLGKGQLSFTWHRHPRGHYHELIMDFTLPQALPSLQLVCEGRRKGQICWTHLQPLIPGIILSEEDRRRPTESVRQLQHCLGVLLL